MKKRLIILFVIIGFFILLGVLASSSDTSQSPKTSEVNTIEVTPEVKNDVPKEYSKALEKAKSYSDTLHMSKKGIYEQLISEVEKFDKEAAQYAIDNLEADYKYNALQKAKEYENVLNMSKASIYDQLVSDVEKFTKEEAQYAIDNL